VPVAEPQCNLSAVDAVIAGLVLIVAAVVLGVWAEWLERRG